MSGLTIVKRDEVRGRAELAPAGLGQCISWPAATASTSNKTDQKAAADASGRRRAAASIRRGVEGLGATDSELGQHVGVFGGKAGVFELRRGHKKSDGRRCRESNVSRQTATPYEGCS